MIKKTVIATFTEAGFHCWPEAPQEVLYLGALHRHDFAFRVEVTVGHSDRESEFHILRRQAKEALAALYKRDAHGLAFGRRSCEMIAEELRGRLLADGTELSAVEVWEDRECGARVEWT